MPPRIPQTRVLVLLVGIVLAIGGFALAQAGPVAAMFADDQKRDPSMGSSFVTEDLAATSAAGARLRVFFSAGDLERAFDSAAFRPDAAIVPTNTDLQIEAASPSTQRVLIDRVQKDPEALRALQSAITARRTKTPEAGRNEPGLLRIGVDHVAVQLRSAAAGRSEGAFPTAVCLVATDFPKGGAIDRRDLFAQDRMRQGIAACLDALDAGGARSLVVPLMGAASGRIQTNDANYEGQRALKECRLINSTAGIALGIHDFAARRHNLLEVGVMQWDQELDDMFKVPAGSRAESAARMAYRAYAEQIASTFRRGVSGDKTTSSDVGGNCNPILNGR